MSVSIATGGMFNQCCGGSPGAGSGGVPPSYAQNSQVGKPTVLIKNVELSSKSSLGEQLDKIKVKLIDFEDD